MTEERIRKLFLYFGVLAMLSVSCLFLLIENIPGHKELDHFLMKRLIRNQPAIVASRTLTSRSDNVAYVLGGSQHSLVARFQTIAALYHHGLCDKILILSNPGITEYEPLLDRNLTNDEWAVNKLVTLGVKKVDIEPVPFRKGFWGTLSEAEGVADLAASRDYRHIILITSQYHTARTWLTFSRAMERQNTTLFIYGSNDDIELPGHFIEYLKLLLYRNFVIPLYSLQIPMLNIGSPGSQNVSSITLITRKCIHQYV